MIEINPKESTTLNFKIDVSGSKETPQSRLFIPISNGISLVFEGTVKDGEVEVNVSELLKLTESKILHGKLEVIVEGSVFYPWEDTIEISESTSVTAESVKTKIKNSKITVKSVIKKDAKEPIIEIKKKELGDIFSDKL